jgi:hypothetical protein
VNLKNICTNIKFPFLQGYWLFKESISKNIIKMNGNKTWNMQLHCKNIVLLDQDRNVYAILKN